MYKVVTYNGVKSIDGEKKLVSYPIKSIQTLKNNGHTLFTLTNDNVLSFSEDRSALVQYHSNCSISA